MIRIEAEVVLGALDTALDIGARQDLSMACGIKHLFEMMILSITHRGDHHK